MDPPEKGSVLEGGGNGYRANSLRDTPRTLSPLASLSRPRQATASLPGRRRRSTCRGIRRAKPAPSCLVRLATRPGSEAESTDGRGTDLRRQTLRAVSPRPSPAAADNGAFAAAGGRSFGCAVGALPRPAAGRAAARLRSRLPRGGGGSGCPLTRPAGGGSVIIVMTIIPKNLGTD